MFYFEFNACFINWYIEKIVLFIPREKGVFNQLALFPGIQQPVLDDHEYIVYTLHIHKGLTVRSLNIIFKFGFIAKHFPLFFYRKGL